MSWSIHSEHPNVHIVDFENVQEGWTQTVMVSSDRHHDNPQSEWELERAHLDKASELGALVIDGGDNFCAMQGKYDPRSNMDYIRPEDVGVDYLDRIVQHAADFYGEYAKLFALFSDGNHESSILRRHGVSLNKHLVALLRERGSSVVQGAYGGWVIFRFHLPDNKLVTRKLKYFHGAGGGGPVTRGVIQTNRQAVYLPDANYVVNGHTHDAWHVPIARERLDGFEVTQDVIHFIRTPGYKQEYLAGRGWHVERWGPPKPLGCGWLRFRFAGGKLQDEISVEVV